MALLHPTEPLIWLNWAAPLREITRQDTQDLTEHFQINSRVPRFEFFKNLWPHCLQVLVESGYVVEKEMPIMVLLKRDFKSVKTAHLARAPNDDEFRAMECVQSRAFGMPEPADDAQSWAEVGIRTGRTLAAVAVVNEQVAGAGYAVGTSEIKEIAGIATDQPFRRQGVATAIISNLLERFFAANGEIAWFTPGDDGAELVYAKLGFKTMGTQVCISIPGG